MFNYTSYKSTLKYIQTLTRRADRKKNDIPYLVILYGAPGSGKTYNITKTIKGMDKNYLYFSVDDFVDNTIQFTTLKNNIHDLTPENINKIKTTYNTIKKATSNMLYTLLGLALQYRYNVVLEMTGAGLSFYLAHFINEFWHNKYSIHVNYFYTADSAFLFKRVEKRSLTNYRFLDYDYFIKTFNLCNTNFKQLLDSENIHKFKSMTIVDAISKKVIPISELN
jgi:hypothetical protein